VQVLALDFDGVLVDSLRETFFVGLRTYVSLAPASVLTATSEDLGPPARVGDEIEAEEIYRWHRRLSPLGNRAEDFGATMAAFDEGVALPSQEDYDRFRATRDPEWLHAFHNRFYRERRRLRDEDPAGWLRLQPPYRPLLELLRRRSGETTLAIVTAKDRAAVRLLLEANGADDLFPEDLVLDKEAGAGKRAHLTRLSEALPVPFEAITFVDDKLNHLRDVAPLGVRCVLAGWGHNSEREHRQARELGFAVATLETAEELLFG